MAKWRPKITFQKVNELVTAMNMTKLPDVRRDELCSQAQSAIQVLYGLSYDPQIFIFQRPGFQIVLTSYIPPSNRDGKMWTTGLKLFEALPITPKSEKYHWICCLDADIFNQWVRDASL